VRVRDGLGRCGASCWTHERAAHDTVAPALTVKVPVNWKPFMTMPPDTGAAADAVAPPDTGAAFFVSPFDDEHEAGRIDRATAPAASDDRFMPGPT
jgi:hypothetical protein